MDQEKRCWVRSRTGRNTFSSTNVDIATLTKGVHLRALNVDSVAAWIDQGICLLTAWWMSRFKNELTVNSPAR